MHILFATDGSPTSEHAIAEAARLLPLKGARATVVTVDDLAIGWPGPEAALGSESILIARDAEAIAADLARAAALLAPTGAEVASVRREGDAATRVLDTAKDLDVDMIVVGSHGRGAVGRLVLGSVSTAIAHRWQGAVMVVGRPAV